MTESRTRGDCISWSIEAIHFSKGEPWPGNTSNIFYKDLSWWWTELVAHGAEYRSFVYIHGRREPGKQMKELMSSVRQNAFAVWCHPNCFSKVRTMLEWCSCFDCSCSFECFRTWNDNLHGVFPFHVFRPACSPCQDPCRDSCIVPSHLGTWK